MKTVVATNDLLASVWDRYRPLMLARLELLDRAAVADPLPATLRQDALVVAHNLSGSLGMFGFPEGTALARELEATLEAEIPDRLRIQPLCRSLRMTMFGSEEASG